MKQGKRLRGGERYFSQRDKTFLCSDAASGCLPFSQDATLYHHFWSVTWQPALGYSLPNGVTGKLVTMAISCGCSYTCSQPCTAHTSQTSEYLSTSPVPHSTAITLPVIICYYITQTAPGHQSHTEHAQNGLIILADRAITPLMIPLA